MSAACWEALQQQLAAAGIAANVDAKPYAQTVYGRLETGVNRTMTIKAPRGLVHVHDVRTRGDQFWRGWEVTAENADDIVVRWWPPTTNRATAAANVVAALQRLSPLPGGL